MYLNYIDIAIVALFLILTFEGYKRGFLISLLEFIRFTLGIPLCFSLSNSMALPVYNSYVRQKALDSIRENVTNTANVDEITKNIDSAISDLPSFLTSNIDTSFLHISSEDVAQAVLVNVFEPILIAIVKTVIFILVFFLFFLATKILIRLASRSRRHHMDRQHKSALTRVNSAFGAIFGFLKSFVVVLAVTSALMFVLNFEEITFKQEFITQISDSYFLPLIDKINPLNYLIGG